MSVLGKAVFLSYASQDAEPTRRIADALRAAGIEVWFDQSELRGGDAWDHKIRKQIKECALFVPIISAHTQERSEGYFRLEWHLAEQRTFLMAHDTPFLLPVVIDGTTDVEARVPDRFRDRQWMRLPGGTADAAFGGRVRALLSGVQPGVATTAASTHGPPHAPARTTRSVNFLTIVLAVAAVGAVLVFWRPWNRTGTNAPPALSPSNGPATATSEARRLAQRAQTIMDGNALSRAQLDTAGDLCTRALQLDDTDAVVWLAAARADSLLIHPYGYDESEERRQQAQLRATRAFNLDPDNFDVRVMYANVMAHAGRTPALMAEAESIIRELIAAHPADQALIVHLAGILREQDRFEEAAAEFASIGDYELVAWSYYQAGRLRDALTTVDRGLQAKRTTTALQLKAMLHLYADQDLIATQAAIDQLRPSELLSEMSAGSAARIALNRRDSARLLQIMGALPVDYLSSHAFRGPKQFFTGMAHEFAGRTGAAESDWRAGLALVQARLQSAPEDRELLLWAAWLQASLGAGAEAERLLDRAQDVAGLDRGTMDTASVRVFLRLGRTDPVLAWLEQIFQSKRAGWEERHAEARFNPIYGPLRDDPRFENLLRDNLPEGAKPIPTREE